MGIVSYEYSDGRYPGFASEIISCHYPLRDDHIEHINRVVVGHLMLRCGQLPYFANRLDATLSREERSVYDRQLQHLSKRFRGEKTGDSPPFPLKQQLVFALAILHDIGKTAFLPDGGHESRAGGLVERILGEMEKSLNIDPSDTAIGRVLIENHTMLGTLVQGEHSASEVAKLRDAVSPDLRRQLLYYLLLLNSMDLSGYRYLPIMLDPYWTSRYIAFSDSTALDKYANDPGLFAEYRLRELARGSIGDVGDLPRKEAFHEACRKGMASLGPESRRRIGTIRICDALYLIIAINGSAIARFGAFNEKYAPIYVRLFETFARIAEHTGAQTLVFRKDASDPDNTDPRIAGGSRIEELVGKLSRGETVVDLASFSKGAAATFTIDETGQIVGVNSIVRE